MRGWCWRGLGGLLAVLCLAVAAAPAAPPVLLVRDTNAEGDYATYVRTSAMQRALRRAGLAPGTVTAAELAGRPVTAPQLAVLPANPTLETPAIDWLRHLVTRGGRLLIAPPLPGGIGDQLGIRSMQPLQTGRALGVGPVAFDRALLPGLPVEWQRTDWVIQPVQLNDTAKPVAGWSTANAEPLAAVTCGAGGAFIAATLEGDDRLAEAQLLLALATTYFPGLWHEAVPRLLAQVGRLGEATGLGQLRDQIEAAPLEPTRRREALTQLDHATRTLQSARQFYQAARREGAGQTGQRVTSTPTERYLPVAELGFLAGQRAEQAWYLAQAPRPDEFVGVWMQQFGDLRGLSWDTIAEALAAHGVDALFVNAVNAGYANYPSQILPHVTAEGDDLIADAVAACRRVGLECHVWMMVNYVRPLTPAGFRERLVANGRMEQSLAGATLPFLTPSLEANVAQAAAVAGEIAARYPLDGLHLDYIRYSPEGDYSPAERARFEASLRRTVADWPRDIQAGGLDRTAWCAWRQGNVDRQLEAIATAVRAARPGVKLSAAVFPIWTDAYYQVGQTPVEWARRGLVDFLCPMNYHTNDTTFYRYLKVQQREAGEAVPLYPGIAAWRQESPSDTIAQIRRLRAEGTTGFLMFHLDRRLLREWLPALSTGLTARPAPLGPLTPGPAQP